MDFGFGAFLEKVEEHFGKWALRALLALIGLTVTLFCAKQIWDLGLHPLVETLRQALGASNIWVALSQVAAIMAGGIAGLAVASILMSSLLRWQHVRTLRRLTAETKRAHEEDLAFFGERAAQLDAMIDRAELVTSEGYENAAAAGKLLEALQKLKGQEDSGKAEPRLS